MSEFDNKTNALSVPSVQAIPAPELQDLWTFKHSLFNASLPLLACSLFFTCSITHLCIALITKRFYMLPLTVGCILGIIGEIFKIICVISTSPSKALNYFVLYSLVTDLVPCLFLTSVGWMVRRMMADDGSNHRGSFPWPVRVVSQQIITLEIAVFTLQAYGLLVQANPLLSLYWDMGNLVTVVGSAIEILNILAVWLCLLIVSRKPRRTLSIIAHQQSSTNFSAFARLIAGSVAFILIRTLSRLVLHLKNAQLEPFKNELLIFLLEGLPLSLCALFLIIFHPCRFDGGIRDQAPSFFSRETPALGGPMVENEMEETRKKEGVDPLGVRGVSDFQDEIGGPFWTVPLSPHHHQQQQSDHTKRPSAHVRLVEPHQGHHPQHLGFPSSPARDHVRRRSIPESQFGPTASGIDFRRPDDLDELDFNHCRHSTKVEEELGGSAPVEGRIRRRTHSAVSFDKNPLGIAEFHNDSKNPRRSPYSISSYYDDASKNFAKDWADEVFSKNTLETNFGPWDEESIYSTEESGK
ncbi:hypothetical protein PGT21_002960 [Puccinia graminis f. sp. tritici]|uniref:Transmembrane protein n=2 Tax=Puccinia graminis f. sp. tritici TaxID=56615 RepID=A0A5B0QHB1_PUCGR|nr:hypothetical protein PGT21_002960 [Puccinia graminis f. sp. tritici]